MNRKAHQNIYLTLIGLVAGYIQHICTGIRTLLGKDNTEQKEFPFLNFILEQGPRSFWKDPTGIRAGRSLFIPILLLFFRDTYFTNPDIDHETSSQK